MHTVFRESELNIDTTKRDTQGKTERQIQQRQKSRDRNIETDKDA